jgi:hypothetical protein
MKRDSAIKVLKLLGAKVPNSQPRSKWIVCDCPLGPWTHDGGASSAEVFGVRIENGDPRVNCFSCGFHGNLSDLVYSMRLKNKANFHRKYEFSEVLQLIAEAEENVELECLGAPDFEEVLFGKKDKLHEYPEWWLDSFPAWHEVPFAKSYLAAREVPAHVANALDIRADTEQRRVCFPVRDFSGLLRGLHGRAVDEKTEPRYRMYLQAHKNNPIIWLGEHWVDLEKPIVVVEGPFDLASVRRVYSNVVSPLFANPNQEKLLRMSGASEWLTFFDRGTGGDAGRKKVDKVLRDYYVQHLYPPSDVKDPGACSVQQLIEILSPYVKVHN